MKELNMKITLDDKDMTLVKNYGQKPYPGEHEPSLIFSCSKEGYAADLCVRPCDVDTEPYVEVVIFRLGNELCCSEAEDLIDIAQNYEFEVERDGEPLKITVSVEVE